MTDAPESRRGRRGPNSAGRADARPPYLIEVAGTAGAGKSTLTNCLADRENFVRGAFIQTRAPRHVAYLMRSVPRLLPVVAAGGFRRPRMTWRELKLMAYATAWSQFYLRRREYHGRVVILDQGPIYALVRLRELNSGVSRTRWFHRWWLRAIDRWSQTLAAVVWLDAADDVLVRRIEEREQDHAVKGTGSEAGRRFITAYRRSLIEAIGHAEQRGVPVLRFDTDTTTPEEIAAQVVRMVGGRT